MTCKGILLAVSAALLAGCAGGPQSNHSSATAVDGVRKVVDTTSRAGGGIEPMVAELLRTRLVERGVPVDHSCAPRCFEVTLQELVIDTARDPSLTPGQLLSVAGGSIPVIGGLVRNIGEREQEKQRAANRASGLLMTYAARDGNRYTARHTLVAITAAGDVALENK